MPDKPKASTLPKVKDLRPVIEIDKKLFKQTSFDCFPLIVEYSAKDYIDLISTYSPILALPPTKREQFLKDIEKLVETRFNNHVVKHYSMSLTLAQKI